MIRDKRADGRSVRQRDHRDSVLVSALIELSVTIIMTALVFTFLLGITVQKGDDMYPALRDGDVIIYYRTTEMVPGEAAVYEHKGHMRTGRIEGTPGMEISETKDHQLTIDGLYMPEYAVRGIFSKTFSAEDEDLPLIVGDDAYFILNDDRTRTTDSREYGEIKKKQIRGRIITVLRRRLI